MEERKVKKGPPVLLVLVALGMVALSVGVVGLYVPIVDCRACEGSGSNKLLPGSANPGVVGAHLKACGLCDGKGKVPFLRKWAENRIKIDLPALPK